MITTLILRDLFNVFIIGLICGYNLQAMNHGTINQPFVVSLLDKRNGRAEIFIKDDVALSACNNHGVYKFFISAFDCGTSTNKKRNTFDQRTSRKYVSCSIKYLLAVYVIKCIIKINFIQRLICIL